eukprot:345648-Chlamydomonas_euryale.AAC.1
MTDINYFSHSASVSGADRKQYLVRKATVGGATFRHQAWHRSHRGPADSRSRRLLPGAGCRNLGACGTRDFKCGYGCVVWHKGFKHPFLTHVR